MRVASLRNMADGQVRRNGGGWNGIWSAVVVCLPLPLERMSPRWMLARPVGLGLTAAALLVLAAANSLGLGDIGQFLAQRPAPQSEIIWVGGIISEQRAASFQNQHAG